MAPPPRPEVDKRSFGPDFLRYHERLVPFFDGTIAALAVMYGLELVTTTPIQITMPSDWVPIQWANNWGTNAVYGKAVWRKSHDGRVYIRGVGARPTLPASGSTFITGLPAPLGVETFYSQTDAGVGTADLFPSGILVYYSGGAMRWPLTGFSYDAADRTPSALGKPFPLTVAWKAYPSLVLVQSTLIDANNRATSQRQLHLVTWTAPPERSNGAFLMTRIQGLAVGAKYDLMVYAAA